MFTEKLALLKYCLCSNYWERVAHSLRANKSEFLVNLDRFLKFLKYFKYFEKRSRLNKNLDFFLRGERATLSYQFEQRQYFDRTNFSVNIFQFLKDAVITVGVSFRLCFSFSVYATGNVLLWPQFLNLFRFATVKHRQLGSDKSPGQQPLGGGQPEWAGADPGLQLFLNIT